MNFGCYVRSIDLPVQCVAHEGEGSGAGVEGTHEAEFHGVTLGGVGGLYVGEVI